MNKEPNQPPISGLSDQPRVTCEVSDGVAHVRLNRPEKRNALDLAMFESLISIGDKLIHRTDVHPQAERERRLAHP